MTIKEAKQEAVRLELWIPNELLEQAPDNVLLEYIREVAADAVARRPGKGGLGIAHDKETTRSRK